MPSLEDVVGSAFADVITCRDTGAASAKLRRIAAEPESGGLGAALLALWQQGLGVGHVPSDGEGLRRLAPSAECPYTFVHVPVRRFRSDHAELARRGILVADPDPDRLIFHEDALVTPGLLPAPVLRGLTATGLLEAAAPDDPRIRCTARGRRPRGPVYLPVGRGVVENPAVARALATRRPCTYCSGAALNPREATATAHVPGAVRTYRFGFTFAPVGEPRQICHVLAWDAPDDGTPVLDMEPQPFSVTELVRLVITINGDIERFARAHGVAALTEPLTGVCNHWAGNSIYHQHYQFLRLPNVPLLDAARLGRGGPDVEVRKATWPCPAYVVQGADASEVARIAERLAVTWHALGADHTQNLLVTRAEDRTVAVVIPRLRSRVDTSTTTLPRGTTLRKGNAAVLEMVGYFVIDSPEHFEALASLSDAERRHLVVGWLAELAPDAAQVARFEKAALEWAALER